jgi:hypothetical protein
MRDWEKLVRLQLAGLALEPEEKDEVITELAAHLDETCEELCRQGLTEEEATWRALSQVKNWPDLRRRIQIARTKEKIMTNRVTQLWFPGLLTFALSMSFLAVIQKFGPLPSAVHLAKLRVLPVFMVYIPWLLSLPLVGALGAYLTNRAGGSLRTVLSSSVFPVLPFAALFLVGFPVSLAIEDHVAHNIMAAAFLTALFGWVLVPGACLLAGGLLAWLLLSRRLGSRRIATN